MYLPTLLTTLFATRAFAGCIYARDGAQNPHKPVIKRDIDPALVPRQQQRVLIGDLVNGITTPTGQAVADIILGNGPGQDETIGIKPTDPAACAADTCCVWYDISADLTSQFQANAGCGDIARQVIRAGFHDAASWYQPPSSGTQKVKRDSNCKPATKPTTSTTFSTTSTKTTTKSTTSTKTSSTTKKSSTTTKKSSTTTTKATSTKTSTTTKKPTTTTTKSSTTTTSSSTTKASATGGGADGSLILSGKEIGRNENLGLEDVPGFLQPIYDKYKSRGISMADLIQFATKHATVTCTNGPRIRAFVGRKDSSVANVEGLLPEVTDSPEYLVSLFANKTIISDDLISLVGAHSTGKQFFVNQSLAGEPFDQSPGVWDVFYYPTVQQPQSPAGVFRLQSDAALSTSSLTSARWTTLANGGQPAWNRAYSMAYVRLSLLGVDNINNLTECTQTLPRASTD